MEDLFKKDCIRTFTGKYVNLVDTDPDTICIEDIAHSLSMQCRFGGHLPAFYSVAQHSVLCSRTIELTWGKTYALEALMHDASEAYLMDIPTPIKKLIPAYRVIEDRLMTVIAKKFGFNYPLSDEVKNTDACMLKIEWHKLMLEEGRSMECLGQKQAEILFLNLFNSL